MPSRVAIETRRARGEPVAREMHWYPAYCPSGKGLPGAFYQEEREMARKGRKMKKQKKEKKAGEKKTPKR